MALTIKQLYDLSLLGISWQFALKEKPVRLSTVVYALAILGFITEAEAKVNLQHIIKKGLPKKLIRLEFDRQIALCVAGSTSTADEVFRRTVESSPKHFAVLPSPTTPYIRDYTALTFPLYLTARGAAYAKQISGEYQKSHNVTPQSFHAACEASSQRAQIVRMTQNKRRKQGAAED